MTGRTHDLAAFTALTLYLTTQTVPQMTLATALVALSANMIGGLLPDIDDVTSDIWDKVRGGSVLARIVKPLIGSHRMVSHSLIGIGIAGYLTQLLLKAMSPFLLADMTIVWWSLMLGYASHLVMDTMTKEGVPWLLPLPVRFGFPPMKFWRVRTGGTVENVVVFPGLILINAYFLYTNYGKVLMFIRGIGK